MSENIMTRAELEQTVDRLLHDAQHKDSGAMMASIMGDMPSVTEYKAEAKRLRLEANALDPEHTCDAWEWDNAF